MVCSTNSTLHDLSSNRRKPGWFLSFDIFISISTKGLYKFKIYEKKFEMEEAPSGILARGHYEAKSKFVDDDNVTHIQWNWSFDIKKDWN